MPGVVDVDVLDRSDVVEGSKDKDVATSAAECVIDSDVVK
jgi:hypothetical protein